MGALILCLFYILLSPAQGNTPVHRCDSPAMWRAFGGPGHRALPPPPAARRFGPKMVRDAFGTIPNTYETENFVLKWGISDGIETEDITALGQAFEDAWSHELETMGYPQPYGTEAYKLNVYIGGTEGNTPDISTSAAGYFYPDPEGFPMVVLGARFLSDTESIKMTAAHEFFHAIQWYANSDYVFGPNEPANWYWEATASWIEGQVYPNNPLYADPVAGFLLFPDLPLGTYEVPDQGTLVELHPYGALLFPQYLGEHGPGVDFIRQTFLETNGDNDPITVADRLLKEQGSSMTEVFFSFAMHNATLDYKDRDWYLSALESDGGYENVLSHRPSGTLSRYSTEWKTPSENLPTGYGSNYWKIRDVPETYTVSFHSLSDTLGVVAVVTRDGEMHNARFTTFSGRESVVLEIEDANEQERWLVVANGTQDPLSVLNYEVRITIGGSQDTDTDLPPSEPSGGCTCNSPGTLSLSSPTVFLWFWLFRRRPHNARQQPSIC